MIEHYDKFKKYVMKNYPEVIQLETVFNKRRVNGFWRLERTIYITVRRRLNSYHLTWIAWNVERISLYYNLDFHRFVIVDDTGVYNNYPTLCFDKDIYWEYLYHKSY